MVLAAKGYPGVVQTGQRIEGLEHLAHEYPDVLAFFAGVGASEGAPGHERRARDDPGGPRPLLSRRPSIGSTTRVSRVRFEGMQFRRDIGRKALTKPAATAP